VISSNRFYWVLKELKNYL